MGCMFSQLAAKFGYFPPSPATYALAKSNNASLTVVSSETTSASASSLDVVTIRRRDKSEIKVEKALNQLRAECAETRKREENLKETIGVKDERISSVEKAFNEVRAECAVTKIAAECKLGEANRLTKEAQIKFAAAEAKLLSAQSLNSAATRIRSVAESKLQEIEAREDVLRRRTKTFKSDCEEKEKEIILERQSLSVSSLQLEHDRLLVEQVFLNQREDFTFIIEEKSKLELEEVSLKKRAEILSKREALLSEKEKELLLSQEKLASKETTEINKVIANHELDMRARKSAFEAELEAKVKEVERDLETKRDALELKEVDLSQREDIVKEKEQELEVQSKVLLEREKDVAEISSTFEEKEKKLNDSEKDIELTTTLLQREKDEIVKMKNDLNESLNSLKEQSEELDSAKEKFEVLKSKINEELTLKKSKVEAEWEAIDEKREELRKEAERLEEERLAFSKFMKDEHDSLRREKDESRDQYKRVPELLCLEQESSTNKMVEEQSDRFSKMQQELADFLVEAETRQKDLENSIDKECQELESSLKEKNTELHRINSLKDKVSKNIEMVCLEMKRLKTERIEIKLESKQRNQEWNEPTNAVGELGIQREKLKEQRGALMCFPGNGPMKAQLLHIDRDDINASIKGFASCVSWIRRCSDVLSRKSPENPPLKYGESSLTSYKEDANSSGDKGHELMIEASPGNIIETTGGKCSLSSEQDSLLSRKKKCVDISQKSPEEPPLKYGKSSLTLIEEDANSSGYNISRKKPQLEYGESSMTLNEDNANSSDDNGLKLIKEMAFERFFRELEEVFEPSPMDSSSSENDSQRNKKRTAIKFYDDELDQRKNKKKRSHQHKETEIPLEQITLRSTLWDQPDNGCNDHNMSISAEEIKEGGDSEMTCVFATDGVKRVKTNGFNDHNPSISAEEVKEGGDSEMTCVFATDGVKRVKTNGCNDHNPSISSEEVKEGGDSEMTCVFATDGVKRRKGKGIRQELTQLRKRFLSMRI